MDELKNRLAIQREILSEWRQTHGYNMEAFKSLKASIESMQDRIRQQEVLVQTLEVRAAQANMKKYTAREILGPWTYEPAADIEPNNDPCLTYRDGTYFINIEEDHYYLLIENEDWQSQSLHELEEILADYCLNANLDIPWVELNAEDEC